MKDTSHSTKAMREELMSKFVTATLFMTAFAAQAQAQESSTSGASKEKQSTETSVNTTDTKDKSGVTTTIGGGLIAAITSEKDGTVFYADATPNASITLTDKNGYYGQLSGMQSLTLNNKEYNTMTIKFMVELGKQIGDGGKIFFRAGREATESGHVYANPLSYAADAQNVGIFGNLTNRMVFGYEKDGKVYELGMIGSKDEGFYVIPNPKYASFWAKGGITLLEKSGVKLSTDGAVRIGNGHKDLLASIGIKSQSGFGAEVSGKYNFVERSGAISAHAWKDITKGWKLMANTVLTQQKDLHIHAGVKKDDVQFSVECSKPKGQSATIAATLCTNLARSKTKAYR